MKIIYFSPIYWSELKQRPQHLAEELSQKFSIVFIEPTKAWIPHLLKNFKASRGINYSVTPKISIFRSSGKFRLPKFFDRYDFWGINSVIERQDLKNHMKDDVIIWLGHPIYWSVVKHLDLSKSILVYDKMDDFHDLSRNKLIKNQIEYCERELLKAANLIFCSSEVYSNRIGNKNCYVINNGLSPAVEGVPLKAEVRECIETLHTNGKKIYGYIGTIDWWFDFNFIERILELDKNAAFVLVGKENVPIPSDERIIYLGSVEKEQVYPVISSFDTCVYPFLKQNFVEGIDPVKMYEYLACNKPTIALETKSTLRFSNVASLYKDLSDLERVLTEIRDRQTAFDSELEYGQFISQNSWSSRAQCIINILNRYRE